MMILWFLASLVATAVSVRCCMVARQLSAHLDYLQREVRELGGQDRWNVQCTHCGRPMRDAASVQYTTRTLSDSGWIEHADGIFHVDRPACAAAADAVTKGAS